MALASIEGYTLAPHDGMLRAFAFLGEEYLFHTVAGEVAHTSGTQLPPYADGRTLHAHSRQGAARRGGAQRRAHELLLLQLLYSASNVETVAWREDEI